MVLLQTILVLIIVYYVFKILWKHFGPRLIRYALRKTGQRFGQQFGGYRPPNQTPSPDGETTIYKSPSSSRKSSKKVGEYIDFEEID